MGDMLDPLRALAPRLAKESDALRGSLKILDSRLNALHIGVEASVHNEVVSVGYGRLPQGWGLYFAYTGGSARSLVDAPRDICVAAVPLIPDLIVKLNQRVEETIQLVEKSAQTAREFATLMQEVTIDGDR